MANQIINTNNLIKKGGAFFTQNFRSSDIGGVVNGYSMEQSNNGNNAYTESQNYGSTSLTINYSEYFNLRKHGSSSHYSDFTIYKGGNYLGSNSYASLGIFLTDQNGDKNDYPALTVGNSRYGIMQDYFGEIVWSTEGAMGRTFTGYGTGSTGGDTFDYLTITGISDSQISVNDYVALISYTDSGSVFNIEYLKITDKSLQPAYRVDRGQLNSKYLEGSSFVGKNGIVVLLDTNWKDLSATSSEQWGAMVQFENTMYVSLDNLVYAWTTVDASDFALKLTLPTGFEILKMDFAKTNYGDRIFIYANKANKSSIFVWDGADSSWEYEVKLEENITTARENYFALDSGIYYTNGVSYQLITAIPGLERKLVTTPIEIEDIRINNNYLLFTSNVNNDESLYRRGLYIYDLVNQEYTYIPPYTNQWYGKIFGATIIDYNKEIYLSHDNKISKLVDHPNEYSNIYQFIYAPENARPLELQEMYLNIDFGMYNNLEYDSNYNIDMDVIVRCYDFREPFSNILMDLDASQPTELNKITLSGTYKAKVGDRIELLEHNAGIIRNITDVSGSTITLDEDITGKELDNTDQVMLLPLKKIGSKSIDAIKMPEDKLKISLTNQPTFKKALFEIEFRPSNTSILPRLSHIELQVNPKK